MTTDQAHVKEPSRRSKACRRWAFRMECPGYIDASDCGRRHCANWQRGAEAQSAAYWSTATAQISISTSNVTPGTAQSTTVNLFGGATYYFRLWTQNVQNNWSHISNGATVQTDVFSPTGLTPFVLGTTSITWSWNDTRNLYVDGYRLRDGGGTLVATLPASPFDTIDFNLSTNTLYAREIEAFAGVSSSVTAAVSTYTLAAPPIGTTFNGVTTTMIGMKWNANNNPSYTRFQAYEDTQVSFATAVSSDTSLSSATFNVLYPTAPITCM